jgi:hypothetical protein
VILRGITPDAPETEYGWIEPGEPHAVGQPGTLARVRRFWEKPSLVVAQALLAKECLWKSFVMVAAVPTLLTMVCRAIPGLCELVESLRAVLGTPAEESVAHEVYSRTRSRDFSRVVLAARPSNLAVLPVRGVAWTDLGDPRRVLATLSRVRFGRERGRATAGAPGVARRAARPMGAAGGPAVGAGDVLRYPRRAVVTSRGGGPADVRSRRADRGTRQSRIRVGHGSEAARADRR